jgi:endogenous inhibitor of DNA gyrase (YacG/DUF329 family)
MIQVRCPICDKPMQAQSLAELPYYPFCSKRCRLIDLGRWLDESYRLPCTDDPPPQPQPDNSD